MRTYVYNRIELLQKLAVLTVNYCTYVIVLVFFLEICLKRDITATTNDSQAKVACKVLNKFLKT